MTPRLIVGLGNPEPKYDHTRHNVGFAVLDQVAITIMQEWQHHRRFHGWFTEGILARQKIYLLKPKTYMNRSGQAVRAVMDWYKLDPTEILVIYDDMDLPLGRLRLRQQGSAGGHNGMKSIIGHLGSQQFPRLRIGIGKSGGQDQTVSHVLGRFTPAEKPLMEKSIAFAQDIIESSLKQGIAKTMSLYNNQSVQC